MRKDRLKPKISSTKAAILIFIYNCLVLPLCSFLLVFAWRVAIGSIYGYAKYDPVEPVLVLLLVGVTAEFIAVINIANNENVKGLLAGFVGSLLLSPFVLFAIWMSIMLGNH